MSRVREEKVNLTLVISRDALEKMGGQIRLAEQLKRITSDQGVQVLGERRPIGWGSVKGPMC